jgi:hypothetical protein
VALLPSPKFQSYDKISPSGSLDPDAEKMTVSGRDHPDVSVVRTAIGLLFQAV